MAGWAVDEARADQPLGSGEFAALMAPLAPPDRLVLAVSGGADSLALAWLAKGWAGATGRHVSAAIIDHGLRPGSADEARAVADRLSDIGLAAEILTVRDPAPRCGLEAFARDWRYRLLHQAAVARQAGAVVTAHHRDDQAETVLLRLAAGSGPDGLAGMAADSERGGLRLLRPFLSVSRARLAATCAAHGLTPIQDPMNEDSRFARPRLRAARKALAEEGLTPARLARLAMRAGRARLALDIVAQAACQRWVTREGGLTRLDLAGWLGEPAEIRLRVLAMILQERGRQPRLARLERLEARLVAGAGNTHTLGGCRLERRGAMLLVRAESPRRCSGIASSDCRNEEPS